MGNLGLKMSKTRYHQNIYILYMFIGVFGVKELESALKLKKTINTEITRVDFVLLEEVSEVLFLWFFDIIS